MRIEKNISILILIVTIYCLVGATPDSVGAQTKPSGRGSADKPEGKIYNVSIFISTPGNRWTKEEKLKTYEKQRAAQKWLVEQAEGYDVELEFQNGVFGLDGEDISVSAIPTSDAKGNGMVNNWGSELLTKIGYKRPMDLWTWVQKNTDCENLQVSIYANGTGVSYTLGYKPEFDAAKYFVEVSFIYRYYSDGRDLAAATVAHENLHAYGAWDLYNAYTQVNDVASKAKQYFPNDIMYRTSYDLTQLEVNELTAWRIGWSDKEEPWYGWFKPAK